MAKVNHPVVQLLLHARQNVDDPDELLTRLGMFLEGLGKANGMSPETMAGEVKRYLDHASNKPSTK
jgi:hypothetical protein